MITAHEYPWWNCFEMTDYHFLSLGPILLGFNWPQTNYTWWWMHAVISSSLACWERYGLVSSWKGGEKRRRAKTFCTIWCLKAVMQWFNQSTNEKENHNSNLHLNTKYNWTFFSFFFFKQRSSFVQLWLKEN